MAKTQIDRTMSPLYLAAAQELERIVEKSQPLPPAEAIGRARTLLLDADDCNEADEYPIDALGSLAPVARCISENAQVRPAMAAQAILGAVALLAQRIANVRSLDGSTKPLSLFMLTVALSGDGKDAADRSALGAVTEWQKRENKFYQDELYAYENRDKGDKSPPPRPRHIISGDITIEGQRRAFHEGASAQGVFSTEAGQILAGHAMSAEQRTKTAASLCALFDRGQISVIRGGAGRFERHGIRLTTHLMLQPVALGDVLTDDSMAGIGFWPRFLLAWPPELQPRIYRPWRADQDQTIKTYWQDCNDLLNAQGVDDCDQLPVIELADDARLWLAKFFERNEKEGRMGSLKNVRPWALRATELACRIGGVVAAWDRKETIDKPTIQNAAKIVMHSLATWQKALAGKADPTPQWALTLFEWLVKRRINPVLPLRILRNLRTTAPHQGLQQLRTLANPCESHPKQGRQIPDSQTFAKIRKPTKPRQNAPVRKIRSIRKGVNVKHSQNRP